MKPAPDKEGRYPSDMLGVLASAGRSAELLLKSFEREYASPTSPSPGTTPLPTRAASDEEWAEDPDYEYLETEPEEEDIRIADIEDRTRIDPAVLEVKADSGSDVTPIKAPQLPKTGLPSPPVFMRQHSWDVLDETEVAQERIQVVKQVAGILQLPIHTAGVLLTKLKWDSNALMAKFTEAPEELFR